MSCRKRRPVLRAWGDPIPRGLILNSRHIQIQTKNLVKIKPALANEMATRRRLNAFEGTALKKVGFSDN